MLFIVLKFCFNLVTFPHLYVVSAFVTCFATMAFNIYFVSRSVTCFIAICVYLVYQQYYLVRAWKRIKIIIFLIRLFWYNLIIVQIRQVEYFRTKCMGPKWLTFCVGFDLTHFPQIAQFDIFQLLIFFILAIGLLLNILYWINID